jgi:chemotaxis family two-component system response regulator Rcp1
VTTSRWQDRTTSSTVMTVLDHPAHKRPDHALRLLREPESAGDLVTTTPIRLLLVEDNLADVRLTREALRDATIPNRLYVVGDGEEALAFMRHEAPYAAQPAPDLVLLDLNLPRKGGREVLAEMKADPSLRRIPVAILTTSASLDDVDAAYELGANSYIVKPVDFDQFRRVIAAIELFWMSTARLPRTSSPPTTNS